jgi:hypothetical protein
MELEKQVVGFELSKRLKELGVKQESLWYWIKDGDLQIETEDHFTRVDWEWGSCRKFEEVEHTAAFTVAELGEMLPQGISTYCTNITGRWGWKSFYIVTTAISVPETFDTEADARAKMLFHLFETKVI